MAYFAPGAQQQLFLLSLTDLNNDIWSDPRQTNMALFVGGLTRNLYIWDLYALSDSIGQKTIDKYAKIDAQDENWCLLWTDNLSESSGDAVYKPLPTTFTVNAFNYPDMTAHQISGQFNISPKIPELSDGEQFESSQVFSAESIIYDACINPGYPLLIASTIPQNYHYGPIFFNSVKFSTSGIDSMNPVSVSISYSGGKTFKNYEISKQDLSLIANQNQSNDPNAQTYRYRTYRNATITDCLVDLNVYESLSDMINAVNLTDSGTGTDRFAPDLQIVGMSLDISQNLEFKWNNPSHGRTDAHGPRYVAINNYIVKGSLTFYTQEQLFDLPRSGPISMYFGSIFLFVMPFVDYQFPSVNIKTGSGYVHELQFIARAAPKAVALPFISDSSDTTIASPSVFVIANVDLDVIFGGIDPNSENNNTNNGSDGSDGENSGNG